MKILALLPALLVLWPVFTIAKKAWRGLALLFLAALITGCAGSTNRFEKSPCACDFENMNMGSYSGGSHA